MSAAGPSDSQTPRPVVDPQPADTSPTLAYSSPSPTGGGATEETVTQVPSVPRYEILGELGRGGMGVVYKARQEGLGRTVALKMILHADHAGMEERQRFQREAKALAELRHENIVAVYEVGEHQGKPFISLEYVESGSLDQHLAGTPLPPDDAARLVQQLANAMQAAHAQSIIHRDLKPANVLLAFSREPLASASADALAKGSRLNDYVPKVTDFGLARKQDEGGLSASGAILGTPEYMAPEQAAGKGKEVGPAADVYALGAILYECLTGRPPFKAATVMDTLLQVMSAEPVPPRQLQPKLPRDLETISLKCLQKDPRKRYSSAAALAEDLRRFLASEPILARPVGWLERLGRCDRWRGARGATPSSRDCRRHC